MRQYFTDDTGAERASMYGGEVLHGHLFQVLYLLPWCSPVRAPVRELLSYSDNDLIQLTRRQPSEKANSFPEIA